jgi:hypothetical protein
MGSWIAALAAGVTGGTLAGLFGIGGGIVLVPLLALLLGLNQHQAQGVTLAALLLPLGLPAVLQYRRQGVRIPWKVVGFLMAGFIPGAYGGADLANRIPSDRLRWCFSAFLLLLALRSLLHARPARSSGSARPRREAWALAIGLAGGVASGLLGIGGGLIMVPLMVWVHGVEQHEAQAASLALMLPPIGLPAVVVYVRAQSAFPWWALAAVAVGFPLGAYLGARLSGRLRGPRMGKAFAGLLVVMALLLLFR